VILQMDGEIMTNLQDVHRRLAYFAGSARKDLVWDVLVVRDGVERWCYVPITNVSVLDPRVPHGSRRAPSVVPPELRLPGIPSGMLLSWCGAIFNYPGRAVLEQVNQKAKQGLDFSAYPYITAIKMGSPFDGIEVSICFFLLELDGVSMYNPRRDFAPMMRFLNEWKRSYGHEEGDQPPDKYVRMKACHMRSGNVRMLSVKPDLHYWPSWTLEGGVRSDI
jgi:hypothetical protein